MRCGAHIPFNIQCTNQVIYIVTSHAYAGGEKLTRYCCIAHLMEVINNDMRVNGVIVTMISTVAAFFPTR